jgi:hypothetical protein
VQFNDILPKPVAPTSFPPPLSSLSPRTRVDSDPIVRSCKFDVAEKEAGLLCSDRTKVREIWTKLIQQVGTQDTVRLSDVGRMLATHFPVCNVYPALMRAFKFTTCKGGRGDNDGWVEEQELQLLLLNAVYFCRFYWAFDEKSDGYTRTIDPATFVSKLHLLGLHDAREEFAQSVNEFRMMRCLADGSVSFYSTLCEWFIKRKHDENRAEQTYLRDNHGWDVNAVKLHELQLEELRVRQDHLLKKRVIEMQQEIQQDMQRLQQQQRAHQAKQVEMDKERRAQRMELDRKQLQERRALAQYKYQLQIRQREEEARLHAEKIRTVFQIFDEDFDGWISAKELRYLLFLPSS